MGSERWIEVGSMRSNTGGTGTAGGAGVTHSPTSVESSARMPSKGA